MRWTGLLLCLSVLGGAPGAHAAIEAVVVVRPTHPPGAGAELITYPGRTLVDLTLQGIDPRRRYNVRASLLDADGKTVAEARRLMGRGGAADTTYFELYPATASAPGNWRLVIEADGERIAERSLVAERVPAPTLARAVVASSISRKREPRRELEVLGIPSAAYYYVDVRGFVPGRAYTQRLVIIDGAGKVVEDRTSHRQGWPGGREVLWFPIVTSAKDAPGTWTLRLDFDDQPVAQATIRAEPGVSRSKAAYLERWWPAVAMAILLAIGYVVYQLRTLPAAVPASAPAPRASLLDASLVALVVANLLPLAAVLYAGVAPMHALFVYLCETYIIAAFAILRIAIAGGESGSRLVAIAIFVFMFGVATVSWGLGLFFYVGGSLDLLELSPEKRRGLEAAAQAPSDLWNKIPLSVDLVYMLAALFVSQSLAFVHGYLKTGAYRVATTAAEVLRPISRLALIHVSFWVMVAASAKGSPLVMLAVVVLLKLLADLHAYLSARGLRQPILGPS